MQREQPDRESCESSEQNVSWNANGAIYSFFTSRFWDLNCASATSLCSTERCHLSYGAELMASGERHNSPR